MGADSRQNSISRGSRPAPCYRLHIGCGRDKWQDAIGVDIQSDSAADVIWDLDKIPWPFPAEAFREVIAFDVLEHVRQFVGVMEEIHRVLAPGGIARIRVPGASSHHQFTDPTHCRADRALPRNHHSSPSPMHDTR
jgi:predicted SAM-dependent methyltransferase